jgi:hypothetical protein
MTYSVILTSRFEKDVEGFGLYCKGYSNEFAEEKLSELVITRSLSNHPLSYSYFTQTGFPYRAYLFKAGRRTQYWIVFSVNEQKKTVKLLRFWNAMQNPFRFRA